CFLARWIGRALRPVGGSFPIRHEGRGAAAVNCSPPHREALRSLHPVEVGGAPVPGSQPVLFAARAAAAAPRSSVPSSESTRYDSALGSRPHHHGDTWRASILGPYSRTS